VAEDPHLSQVRPHRSQRTVAVTGATGLVGTALICALDSNPSPATPSAGPDTGPWSVRRITRKPRAGEFLWDAASNQIDPAAFDGADTVVHLAGENIAGGRWNASLKQRIQDSRVLGTRAVCAALGKANRRPAVLVAASAIGFYGDRQDEELDESSAVGSGFLAEVCQAWEEEARAAEQFGVRVVHLRIGVVLSRHGGALQRMLLPFRLGLGGRVGSGKQYWSWVELSDLIGMIVHAIDTPSLTGAVNAVAPQPVTNAEFTRDLGKVLKRPTVFPMPAFAARLALGEMADALLLSSSRVLPRKLVNSGFQHRFPDLPSALRHAIQT